MPDGKNIGSVVIFHRHSLLGAGKKRKTLESLARRNYEDSG
jgi:hypothetical protein